MSGGAWRRCVWTAALCGALASPAGAKSVGTPGDGRLVDGFKLPLTGTWHRFVGPVQARGTNFATLELAALIARAARTVARAEPGAPMVLADASVEDGGDLPRHASHESGRDVDVLFYVRDARGTSVPSPGFRRFDGDGRCVDEGCELSLDVARTWWAVRTFVASQRPAVQYIFVADPIRSLLLAHARRAGEHGAILRRAEHILRQPSDSSAHDDHLHLRVFCSPADHSAGCEDSGPRWAWVDERGLADPIAPARSSRRAESPPR
jgi:penicillin-insensitive murein endopeptidase